MKERFIKIADFDFAAIGNGNGAKGVYVPYNVLLTHTSSFGADSGAPSAQTFDIQDDGSDITGATAIDLTTNVLTTLTTPASVAAGSVIEIDLNLTGGTTPTWTGQIALWGFVDE
jgi:hypothetical protein